MIMSVIENNSTRWFLKILKIVLPYALLRSTFVYTTKRIAIRVLKRYLYTNVPGRFVTTVRSLEATHMSLNR